MFSTNQMNMYFVENKFLVVYIHMRNHKLFVIVDWPGAAPSDGRLW